MQQPRLTKSLFVEFTTNPHIARRHIHNKDLYLQILDGLYGSMDGLAVGKAVEQQVLQLFAGKNIINIEKLYRAHHDWYQSYHQNTMQTIDKLPDVIYQAWFCFDNLFVKTDLLVKNKEWTYDLCEVKAKNSVRKKNQEIPLLDELIADISFQHFVLKKVLGDRYSWRAMLVYLNKDYIKKWSIDPIHLLVKEDVTSELWGDEKVLETIDVIIKNLHLPREEFIKVFPYNWEDHLTFFGEKHTQWSIWNIPQIKDSKTHFVLQNKLRIANLTEEDRQILFSTKSEETKASKYISLWNQWEKVIQKEAIQAMLGELQFPLYFYDYETVSRPIPLLEGTKPRQQVVVQYSVHKMEQDGTITHSQDIIRPWEADNSRVIQHLMNDLWMQHESMMWEEQAGTYIVWYKGFENTRNTEIALQYPQYAAMCQYINDHTFDLMEIFSELHYFHRDFQWSASIKKVLPVMTDISYENMAIPHGGMAAETLMHIVTWLWHTPDIDEKTKNLLEYCTQDTWAMVRIYEEVKKEVS